MAPQPTSPDSTPPAPVKRRGRPRKSETEKPGRPSAIMKNQVAAQDAPKGTLYDVLRTVEGSSVGTRPVPAGPSSSAKKLSRVSRPDNGETADKPIFLDSDDEAAGAPKPTPSASKTAPTSTSRSATVRNGPPGATPSSRNSASAGASAHTSTGQKRKRPDQDAASDSSERRNAPSTYHGPVDSGAFKKRFRDDDAPSTAAGISTPRAETVQTSLNSATHGPSSVAPKTTPMAKPQATPDDLTTPYHPFKSSGISRLTSEGKGKDKQVAGSRTEENEWLALKKSRTLELEQKVKGVYNDRVGELRKDLEKRTNRQLEEFKADLNKRITEEIRESSRTAVQCLSAKVDQVAEENSKLGQSVAQVKEEGSTQIKALKEQCVGRQVFVDHQQYIQRRLDRQDEIAKSQDTSVDNLATDLGARLSSAKKSIMENANKLGSLTEAQSTLKEAATGFDKAAKDIEKRLQASENAVKEHALRFEGFAGFKNDQDVLHNRVITLENDLGRRLVVLENRKPTMDGLDGLVKKCAAHGQEIERLKLSEVRTTSELAKQLLNAISKKADVALRTRMDLLVDEVKPISQLLASMSKQFEESQKKHQEDIDQMKQSLEKQSLENKSLKKYLAETKAVAETQSRQIGSLRNELADTKKLVQTQPHQDVEPRGRVRLQEESIKNEEIRSKNLEKFRRIMMETVDNAEQFKSVVERVDTLEAQQKESGAILHHAQNLAGSLRKFEDNVNQVRELVEAQDALREQVSKIQRIQEKHDSAATANGKAPLSPELQAVVEGTGEQLSKLAKDAGTQEERLKHLESRISTEELDGVKTSLAEMRLLKENHKQPAELQHLGEVLEAVKSLTVQLQSTNTAVKIAENDVHIVKQRMRQHDQVINNIESTFFTSAGGQRLYNAIVAANQGAQQLPSVHYMMGNSGGNTPTSQTLSPSLIQADTPGLFAMHSEAPSTSPHVTPFASTIPGHVQYPQAMPATAASQQRPGSQPQARQVPQSQERQGVQPRRMQAPSPGANMQHMSGVAAHHQRRASGPATGRPG